MKLDNVQLSQMLETAKVAARMAGQKALEQQNYSKRSIKGGNEIVTQVDGICQEIIVNRIKESYPDHGFVGEEGSEGQIFKQSPRGAEPVWWIIDPIDGTNNYAHNILLFAVSIAAIYEGRPVVGVIFEPATDSMYTAVEGQYAHLNDRRITVTDEKIDEFASIGFDSHFEAGIPDWAVQSMTRTRFRNFGTTTLQLAYVASGGLVATIVRSPKLWDVAAGALLVEQAGGIIRDWHGNKLFPVDMDQYQKQEMPILAANKTVYPELAKLMP